LSLRSNPGLKFANAFGVQGGLKFANAFGVKNPGLNLPTPSAFKNRGLKFANAFSVQEP